MSLADNIARLGGGVTVEQAIQNINDVLKRTHPKRLVSNGSPGVHLKKASTQVDHYPFWIVWCDCCEGGLGDRPRWDRSVQILKDGTVVVRSRRDFWSNAMNLVRYHIKWHQKMDGMVR